MSAKKKEKKEKLKEVVSVTREVGEKVEKRSKSFWQEFKKFAVRGNIIDLAVAVVIGSAFNKIVSTLVSSIITPLTGLLLRTGDLSGLKWVIVPEVPADEVAGIEGTPEVAVTYGLFLQSLIDFLIISLTIFVVVKILTKIREGMSRKEIEAAQAKARAEEEKKKAEEEKRKAEEEKRKAEEERLNKMKSEFVANVAAQTELLAEIRDTMRRLEREQAGDK
ncbi:MAG: large conductance mechanosensitive channel protein MscL [Eubacteriales bacterium]|jgi:large conductance mechanosensitive channel